jgi:Protein of unknown function (DUF4238)
MDNKPRDHHFVPVFYLKQWASSSTNKVIEYSIKHGKFLAKPVGPKGTGYQTDLYSFPELPPNISQHIEDVFLRHSDNEAARALQRILAWDKSEWPPNMIQAWARCVMHLLLRHPDAIAEMRVAAKQIWEGTGEEAQRRYEQEIQKPGDPATFEEYLHRADPLAVEKSLMNMIIRAIDNEAVGTAIAKMIWKVVDVTRSPKTLLTSDRPVVMNNLRSPDGWIALPVSPTKLFIAVNAEKTAKLLDKGTTLELVETMNDRIVGRARRYVWARDPWQEWYVRQNMGKRKEPTPLFPHLARLSAAP